MEVEASLVDDDGCSREVFARCSTQGRMGKKVQIIDVCSNKLEVKNEEEEKRKGFNLRRKYKFSLRLCESRGSRKEENQFQIASEQVMVLTWLRMESN
jgi:hypothetical protein